MLERDATGAAPVSSTTCPALGRRVRYVLDYDFTDAPAAFSWSLVEGDMLRALDGRYVFAPNGAGPDEGGTHVDYTLSVDLAVPMPGLVKRRASGMIMGTALRDLQRAVEVPTDEDEAGDPPVEHDEPDDETPDDDTPSTSTPATSVRAAPRRPTRHRPAASRRGPLRRRGHRGAAAPAAVDARERAHRAARRGAGGEGPRARGGRRAARRGEGTDRRRRPRDLPASAARS